MGNQRGQGRARAVFRTFTVSNVNEPWSGDANRGQQGASSLHIPLRWFR